MNNAKCFDRICDKYYSTYGSNPEYTYFLEEFMRVVRKGKILDIGCGVGLPVAKYLVTKGYDVVAVDSSKKMIQAAKENVPEAECINEDILKIDLEEQSYDGIVSFFTFNFMKKKDFEKCMERLSIAVKEEGGMLIGVMEGELDGETKLLGETVYIHEFTEKYLKSFLKDFNMFLIETRKFHPPGQEPQNQLFIIAKKKSYVEMMIEETDKPQEEEEQPKAQVQEEFEVPDIEEAAKKMSQQTLTEERHHEEQTKLDLEGNVIVPEHGHPKPITLEDLEEPAVKPAKKEKPKKEDTDKDDKPLIKIRLFSRKKKQEED